MKPINYRNLSNLVYFKTTKTVQILSHSSTAKWPNIISLCVKSFTIRFHEVHCTLTNKSMNTENLKAIISLESKHLQTPCTQLFRDQNLRERLRTFFFVVAAGKWFITWNALTWNKKTTLNKISGSFSVSEKQFWIWFICASISNIRSYHHGIPEKLCSSRINKTTLPNIYPRTERVWFNWEYLCSLSSFIHSNKFLAKTLFNRQPTVFDGNKLRQFTTFCFIWDKKYQFSLLNASIFL